MNAKLLCFLLIIAGASCTFLPLRPGSLLNAGSNLLNRRKSTTTTTTTVADESSEESNEESSTESSNPLLPFLEPLESGVTMLDNIRNWVDQLGHRQSTSTTSAPRSSTRRSSTTSSPVPARQSKATESSSAAPSSTSAAPSSTSAAPSSTSAAPSSTSAAPRSSSAAPSSSSAAPSSSSAAPSSSSAAPSSSSAEPEQHRERREVSGDLSAELGSSSISTSVNINMLNDLMNALKNADMSMMKSMPQISLPKLPTLPDLAEAVKKARQLIASAISDVVDIKKAVAQATEKALLSADPNGAIINLIKTIVKTAYDVAIRIPASAGLIVLRDGILIAQAVAKAVLAATSSGLSMIEPWAKML